METVDAALRTALAPVKRCPTEDCPEVQIQADWAGLLDPGSAAGAARARERTLERSAARRYAPERLLLVMEHLLSDGECDRLNRAAEAVGFGKTNYPRHYRGNLRLIATDAGLAAALWERVRPFVPAMLRVPCSGGRTVTWRAVGLNECFRLAKYHPGDGFGKHVDADFERSATERSFYTVNVYTNTVVPEHGGCTRFYVDPGRDRRAGKKSFFRFGTSRPGGAKGRAGGCMGEGGPDVAGIDLAVRPEAGVAAVFRHSGRLLGDALMHDGEPLRGGVKYLLRTDVMYRTKSESED
eukprot:g6296.t1